MGWLYTTRCGMTVEAFLTAECLSWPNMPEDQRPTIVAWARGPKVIAAAVRTPKAYLDALGPERRATILTNVIPDADSSVTTAAVFLIDIRRGREGYDFGYKDMSEFSGPMAPVSDSILKHLSAVTNTKEAQWARNWRERCKAYSAERRQQRVGRSLLRPGVKVRLAEPVRFSNGFTLQDFEARIIPMRRRRGSGMLQALAFWNAETQSFYRLSRALVANATLTANAPETAA
jgi:hypothetical protein